MSITNAADRISHWFVVNSRNNGSVNPPKTPEEQRNLVRWSMADTTIFGANAAAALTPAAPLVGAATAVWGFGQILVAGIRGGLAYCSTDRVGPRRLATAGAALMVGGLSCALLPGPAGVAINAALATWSGAETWAAQRPLSA